MPIYPTAVFLRAYDAGRGQHYYVFGVTVPFAEMVTYYKNVLKEKGNLVFEVPPTHVFETGRFRDETMAFPPSVTVKDYTFSGSGGLSEPTSGHAARPIPDTHPNRARASARATARRTIVARGAAGSSDVTWAQRVEPG